jgi:hypothetical protein
MCFFGRRRANAGKSPEEGEAVSDRRDAIAGDLRILADDFRNLLESATTDPKVRKRNERRWRVLYGVLGAVTTLAARRVATKAWAILTGERPPIAQPTQAAPPPMPAGPTSAETLPRAAADRSKQASAS